MTTWIAAVQHVGTAASQLPVGVVSALISAFVALTVSLATGREARRWKRTKYFLETVERMNASPGSRNALLMIFHEEAMVPLFADGDGRWQRVAQDEAAKALLSEADRVTHLDDRQSALRNSLIDLVSQLDRIRAVARTTGVGRVASRGIVGAIGEALCGSQYSHRGGPARNYIAAALKWHLEYVDMVDCVLFFRRLGYDVRFKDRDLELLRSIAPDLIDPRLGKLHGTVLTKISYLAWLRDLWALRLSRWWRRVRLWTDA